MCLSLCICVSEVIGPRRLQPRKLQLNIVVSGENPVKVVTNFNLRVPLRGSILKMEIYSILGDFYSKTMGLTKTVQETF